MPRLAPAPDLTPAAAGATINPSDYLTEAQVIEEWENLFDARALRRARRRREIDFYAFPAGPCYTARQVQCWLDRTYLRSACEAEPHPAPPALPAIPESAGNMAGTISTSPTPTEAVPGTPADTTSEVERFAAEACAQRILSRRSARSSGSSPRPPAPRTKRLTLARS